MEKAENRIPEIVSIAERVGVKVSSITMHKPSLDDVFIHYTGRAIRSANA
jgi:ABC-2 type transport system ATP-binding protein